MNYEILVFTVYILLLYWVPAETRKQNKKEETELGCNGLKNWDIRKQNITDVIVWKLYVIEYKAGMVPGFEYNPVIKGYDRIGSYAICQKIDKKSELKELKKMRETLCNGLKLQKTSITNGGIGADSKPLTYRVYGKLTADLLLQTNKFVPNNVKSVEYWMHTVSSLGIPTMTWFAGSVGNFETEGYQRLLHLEPGAYHVAEAIVDFIASYNWNVISVVISRKMAGYQLFLKELKRVRNERSGIDGTSNKKNFKFDIADEFYIDDLSPLSDRQKRQLACKRYLKPGTDICPYGPYDKLLKRISDAHAKVIIYHGDTKDFYYLSQFFKKYNTTIFGKEYVWILTPASVKVNQAASTEAGQVAGIPLGMGIPGMFAFSFEQSEVAMAKYLEYATEIFTKASTELLSELNKTMHKTKEYSKIEDIVLPKFDCDRQSKSMFWDFGDLLFQKMKNTTFLDKEKSYVGFLDNGYINTTELIILNSHGLQVMRRRRPMMLTKWFKVGSWSMSNKFPQKTNLQIDGITFSGGLNQPPTGRPKRAILKVATLKERPFIVYSMPNKNNNCDQNTITCYVNPASMNQTETPVQADYGPNQNRTNVTKVCCGGLTIDLLLKIKDDLNFDVHLFEVEDRTWGIKTENGWNGLVKVLLDGKADMVVTAFKITPNRSAAVDFSIPFQETGITIAVALREGKISHTAFLEPYDFSSWCVILIFSVHACGAALFVYEWLSPQGLDRGNVAPRDDGSSNQDHRFSLFRSLWLIWSMLFSASVNADNPRGVASRVLASIWALFALVFLASYTANLAAFMIAKEEFYDLKGIKDFRLMKPWGQKPPFRFATVPSGATEENIRINFPRMAQYMETYNKTSVTEGIKALKNGDIDAFIYDAYVLDYLETHDEKCKLKTVRNWFAMTGYGIAFPKKSKWIKKVNERILEYQKNGKMQRWKKFWLSGNCKKSNQLGNTNKTLGVKNFISAFILLVGGMILCTVLLVLEHAFYRYMRPRIKSWDKYGCCGLVSISMGQLLSFEQSVNQTVDLIKHHKCKNPICETQLWKARHELDMARRKIRKLETAWHRNTIDHETTTTAAITYPAPQSSASIPALASAPLDSAVGASGLRRSSTPDTDFHARSEPALNEESNPLCSCHLNNLPYPPLDDATSEHSRLLPPALPPRAIAAHDDWNDTVPSNVQYPRTQLGHPRHLHHHPHHDRYNCEPPPGMHRPKSSGNIAINNKYNPPEYEMIEKESVL